jgi:hypothetical protein
MGSLENDKGGESLGYKILDSIGEVKISVAGLRSDVGHLTQRIDGLSIKVNEIERSRPTIDDLKDTEGRMVQTVASMKAQTLLDLGRLDKDKIGHDQFSLDSYENLTARLDGIDAKLEDIDRFRYKLIGIGIVVGAIFSTLGGFLFKAITH